MFSVLPLGLVGLLAADYTSALRLPIEGRRTESSRLARRASLYGVSTLDNGQDFKYYTNITLGGVTFQTLIDTGSSDLWVAANSVPGAVNTGFTSGVQYAVGEVQGPVMTAALEFADHAVADQAFLLITPSNDNPEGLGLIGLGPSSGSTIFEAVGGQTGGLTVLDRIFRENTSTPNYITVLMGRFQDTDESFALSGDVTVGEILPGYENVAQEPKLPVTAVTLEEAGNQHWQTLLDANGISVGGKAISGLTTTVPTTSNTAQLTAVFDTGFSIPQVSTAIANGIYSGVTDAVLTNVDGLGEIWVLPCDSEINLSFTFGGVQIPIHPLDTVLDANLTTSKGAKVCAGGFQPISTDTGGNYDIILGMAFIRNVYMYINFGDFVDSTATSTANPYIQLLPITNDSSKAHSEFQSVRGAGASKTGTSSGSSPTTKSAGFRVTASGTAALVALGSVLFGLTL